MNIDKKILENIESIRIWHIEQGYIWDSIFFFVQIS